MMKCNDKKCEEAVRILKALSHPVRLTIIRMLAESQCNVSQLEKQVGLSQSGVSQHLRILRLSGIIEPKRDGKEICYQIVDDKAAKVIQILIS